MNLATIRRDIACILARRYGGIYSQAPMTDAEIDDYLTRLYGAADVDAGTEIRREIADMRRILARGWPRRNTIDDDGYLPLLQSLTTARIHRYVFELTDADSGDGKIIADEKALSCDSRGKPWDFHVTYQGLNLDKRNNVESTFDEFAEIVGGFTIGRWCSCLEYLGFDVHIVQTPQGSCIEWTRDGVIHMIADMPAQIYSTGNGIVKYYDNGVLHRKSNDDSDRYGGDMPTVFEHWDRREWHKNGMYYRKNPDHPPVIDGPNEVAWYSRENGLFDRAEYPAVIWADGVLEYWQNGLRHRCTGMPAIMWNGRRDDEYWQMGVRVNGDGGPYQWTHTATHYRFCRSPGHANEDQFGAGQ